jgi:hypothetical protein
MSKEEVKADWDKVPQITKAFTFIAVISLLTMVLSVIIDIWWEAFPGFKVFLTGLVIFAVSAWLVRSDVLDENGDIKDKYKKAKI